MSTALVTGASGFIGTRLIARLREAGYEVAGLVRSISKAKRLESLGVKALRGDVTDPVSLSLAVQHAEVVFHLAGRTHANSYADFLKINEKGTAHLIEACAQRESPPKVVVVSSLAAAGPSPPDATPHTEETPPTPISAYGRSKLAGELAARRFAESVPITILRPPVVFGPGDRDGFTMFQAVRRMRLHLVPSRSGLPLSLIYADDLAGALVLAAEKGERLNCTTDASPHDATGLYYAADPEIASYAEMGRLAAKSLGCRVLVLRFRKWPFLVPAMLGEAIGRLTGKPTFFGMDKLREASATGWVCSNKKAESQLGFRPAKSLEERYGETVAWYREEGWL